MPVSSFHLMASPLNPGLDSVNELGVKKALPTSSSASDPATDAVMGVRASKVVLSWA